MTNEKKRNTRKETTKKPATNKKVEEVVEKEISEEAPVEEAKSKPARAKRIDIDKNELISCRSTVSGRLIYRTRENEKIVWSDYGAERYLEMGELIRMKGEFSQFLKGMLLVVDDEEAAQYLGLDKIYSDLFDTDDLDSLFDKSNEELGEILSKLPKGLKKTVATHARKMIENHTLDSMKKISLIEKELGVDLQLFVDYK